MGKVYTPREMLEKLVAFPTVSRDTNVPLIDFVEDYLAGHGVELSMEHVCAAVAVCGELAVADVDDEDGGFEVAALEVCGGSLFGELGGPSDLHDDGVASVVPEVEVEGLGFADAAGGSVGGGEGMHDHGVSP